MLREVIERLVFTLASRVQPGDGRRIIDTFAGRPRLRYTLGFLRRAAGSPTRRSSTPSDGSGGAPGATTRSVIGEKPGSAALHP
jgi:hypothetical protein